MIEIPTSELLDLLHARGYKILIERTTGHATVSFSEDSCPPYILPHSYELSWKDNDIRQNVAYDLLSWSELEVKYTLDY